MPALSLAIGSMLLTLGASEERLVLTTSAESDFRKGAEASDPSQARRFFTAAGDAYETLATRDKQNPALYRNLGNARFLAGQAPEAIFAFRRGLRLAPDDGVLRDNLEYARARVEYPPGARPPAEPWPAWLPAHLFLAMALLAHALGWLAWTRRRPGWMSILFAAAGLLTIAWGVKQLRDHRPETIVVVAADDVPLRRGNGDDYPARPDVSALARGMEASLLFRRGDWLQVRLFSGHIGWVQNRWVLVE